MSFLKKLFGGRSEKATDEHETAETSPGYIILRFKQSIGQLIEWEYIKNVDFAMWLPCEEDNLPSTSPLVEKWSILYDLTHHYWSYITADLLKTLGIIQNETLRMGLPEDFQAYPFLTADGEQVILSLSREKGIRLHFAATTSLPYRIHFLDEFISYCQSWKKLIDRNKGKKDEDIGFTAWWNMTRELVTGLKEKEPVRSIGKIVK